MSRAILVPVDGSNFAEHALPYALGVARRTAAVLHLGLVHTPVEVLNPNYPLAAQLERQDDRLRAWNAGYMEDLVARLRPSGVDVRPALLEGPVVPTLRRFVEENCVELVIMTTHGRGGVERAWLGSNADGLLRTLEVPLLLVRPSEETREIGPDSDQVFRRVVAAMDGSDMATAALRDAAELGVLGNASITLAHVLEPPVAPFTHYVGVDPDLLEARKIGARHTLEALLREEWLRDRPVNVEVTVDHFPAECLLDLANHANADLIVVGTRGRGPLKRLLLGSVADKVIRGTYRPVLVRRGGSDRPRQDTGAAPETREETVSELVGA